MDKSSDGISELVSEHISARVPRTVADAIEARARAEGRKRSAVIAHLLEQALLNVPVGQDGRRQWAA